MSKELFVTVKNVYGVERIYPACTVSKTLAQLAGHTTFTEVDVRLLKQLGYTMTVLPATLPV